MRLKNIFYPLFFIMLTLPVYVTGYSQELTAKAAYAIHPTTGMVLMNKNGNARVGPASLTKMMTLYVLFDALKNRELQLDTEIPVSEAAWRKGGSKMFIEVGKTVKVEDLIRGIAISSGNDACIAVAEYLGGTEANFAAIMNQKAEQLGLTGTQFRNSSGWPDPEQYTTARDMVTLATAIIRDFPTQYKYFSELSFTYSGISQPNRNWLLKRGIGVDGMKTGHTEADGYHLVSSMKRNGERIVAAVLGTDSMAARANESQAVLNTAAAGAKRQRVVKNAQILAADVPIHLGTKTTTALAANRDLTLYLNAQIKTALTAETTYSTPLVAPVATGTEVGKLTLTTPHQVFEIGLVTTEDIAKDSWFNRYLRHAGKKLGL